MEFILSSTNAAESFENEILKGQFQEIFLLVRALHLVTPPGSNENKIMENLFRKLVKDPWNDKNVVIKLTKEISKELIDIFKADISNLKVTPSKNESVQQVQQPQNIRPAMNFPRTEVRAYGLR